MIRRGSTFCNNTYTMFTAIRRVISGGTRNFVRSGAVSVATVIVMTVTLMIITFLIFLSALLTYTLTQIQDKVDVSVYFTTDAAEGDILNLKDQLQQLPSVASVSYTSSDEALMEFKQRHANDQLTLNALNELGSNPLGASLSIKATDPTQYQNIVNYISNDSALQSGGTSIIDHIDYYENEDVINRLTSAIRTTERAGLIIVVIFALASTIIAIATVRLAIYSSRDEIAVMRLVGASNAYIQGPFVFAGVLGGIISAAITLIIFTPLTWYLGRNYTTWLAGFDVSAYYATHALEIVGIVVGAGVLLGGFASILAVRRYLNV
jgi:cell division transport system permease protein